MKKIKWIAISSSIPILVIAFLCIGIFVALLGGAGDAASSENCDDSSSSSITDQNFNKEAFEKVVKEKCGAFSDKAEKIEEESKKAGVSPLLMASIMASESGWGTSAAIKNDNNPSGQMNAGGIIHYNSLDEGIEATGKTLHNLVIEQKLDTIEKLGEHYAPVGASNDPNNLNANWVPSVTKMMKTFNGGKDAGGSIATGSDGCTLNGVPGKSVEPNGNKGKVLGHWAAPDKLPKQFSNMLTLKPWSSDNISNSPFQGELAGQCTEFTWSYMSQLWSGQAQTMGNGGDVWKSYERMGAKITDNPTLGYGMSASEGYAWASGAAGHTGVVVAVFESGSYEGHDLKGAFLVEQFNGPGEFRAPARKPYYTLVNGTDGKGLHFFSGLGKPNS